MAPIKRARVAAAVSEAKKAKVVDPVTEKIDLVTQTISDPSCPVAGHESHRDMLLETIPHTLTVPSDERHAYQTQVCQMVGTVLSDYVCHWEKTVADFQTTIVETKQAAAATMKSVEESCVKINEQEAEVQKCKDELDADSQAATSAEEALQAAAKEVAEFDEKLQETIVQKGECNSVYEECFLPVKEGTKDSTEVSSLLKRIQPMLKKLQIESSLLSAIAPALKKSASERGPFDLMAVEGATNIFMKYLGEMQEQIDQADVLKAAKVSSETAAQDALNAAVEKRTASQAALKTAEDDLSALEANHSELYKASCHTATAEHESDEKLATKEKGLEHAKKVLEAFTELLERPSTVPEPEPAVSMVEEKVEAINEDTSMEPVAVA